IASPARSIDSQSCTRTHSYEGFARSTDCPRACRAQTIAHTLNAVYVPNLVAILPRELEDTLFGCGITCETQPCVQTRTAASNLCNRIGPRRE
uniref:Uncharacterized protein n=1 Tax=Anopheles dirus TaxID=7168 RepID=A0A182NYU3_9DIPT